MQAIALYFTKNNGKRALFAGISRETHTYKRNEIT